LANQDIQEKQFLGNYPYYDPAEEQEESSEYSLEIRDTGQLQTLDISSLCTMLSTRKSSKITLICAKNVRARILCIPDKLSQKIDICVQVLTHATIDFVWEQQTKETRAHLINATFSLHHEAQLTLVYAFSSCSTFTKIDSEIFLLEEHARVIIASLHALTHEQKYAFAATVHHQAPYTFSRLITHGVITQESRALCKGILKIVESAHQSDAQQTLKQIILDKKSRALTIPVLEVATKRVTCKHGSAIGTLDQDSLWSLASRGIDPEKAQKICLRAFLITPLLTANLEKIIVEKIVNCLLVHVTGSMN